MDLYKMAVFRGLRSLGVLKTLDCGQKAIKYGGKVFGFPSLYAGFVSPMLDIHFNHFDEF